MRTDPVPPPSLIVARASNGVIGRDGGLPWRLPADLKRFKALTMGGVLIMGRKTFESLPGILPGRQHVVLTRDVAWGAPGVKAAHSVAEALVLQGDDPAWVIGGAEIFALFMPFAQRIELTEVEGNIPGDTLMPDPRDEGPWREVSREIHAGDGDAPPYSFVTLVRA